MRDHDDGPTLAVEREQDAHDFPAGHAVQCASRLVRKEHVRIGDDGARDRRALLLAARQQRRKMMDTMGELHALYGLRGASPPLCAPHPGIGQRQFDVIDHRLPRQQVIGLEDEADAAVTDQRQFVLIELGAVSAIEQQGPRGRPVKQAHQVHQGRLSGAGGPEDGDELSGTNHQRG